jgi:hypothetical protein
MTITINGTSGVTLPAGGVANPEGSYVGTSDTQALSAKTVSFVAGTTTVPPITFTASNSLLSSVTKGAVELDSSTFYYAAAASARGVLPSFLTFCLTANSTGAASTSAQAIFGVSNGSTLDIGVATTYLFKMNLGFTKAAGTAATSLSLGFAGTATVSNIFYRGNVYSANNATVTGYVASGAGQGVSTTTAATVVFAPITSASAQHQGNFYGVVTFSGTGTFIPQYTLSDAGGALTLLAGSNITLWPVGSLGQSGTSVYVGNWT